MPAFSSALNSLLTVDVEKNSTFHKHVHKQVRWHHSQVFFFLSLSLVGWRWNETLHCFHCCCMCVCVSSTHTRKYNHWLYMLKGVVSGKYVSAAVYEISSIHFPIFHLASKCLALFCVSFGTKMKRKTHFLAAECIIFTRLTNGMHRMKEKFTAFLTASKMKQISLFFSCKQKNKQNVHAETSMNFHFLHRLSAFWYK